MQPVSGSGRTKGAARATTQAHVNICRGLNELRCQSVQLPKTLRLVAPRELPCDEFLRSRAQSSTGLRIGRELLERSTQALRIGRAVDDPTLGLVEHRVFERPCVPGDGQG